MEVSVIGAESQRTGDTLKIEYPVLKDKNDRIPDWVINPGIGGVTGALGVAARTGLGTREQIGEARLDARIELASMLEARIQSVGRGETSEDIRATLEQRTEQSRKNLLGVDRDIMDVVLAGTRQRALWFDPENDECYVWLVLDGKVLNSVDHEVIDSVSVFLATVAVATEYQPERRKPEVPKVIVQPVRGPEPAPAPEAPKTPIEELEDSLKPIKTIPIKVEGEGEKGGAGK